MLQIFDKNATKKPTNLSINSDLLSKARKQKINLSATLEHALESELRKTERENWLKDNKDAIDSLNMLAEQNGLFSDKYRNFLLIGQAPWLNTCSKTTTEDKIKPQYIG
jgi:antitoxin CcdA